MSSNHTERLIGGKETTTGKNSDSLFARIDQIGVDLILSLRIGSKTENTVLGLQEHSHAGRNEIGDEHRQTNAEVGVHAVLELERRPSRDSLAHRVESGLAGGLDAARSNHFLLDVLLVERRFHQAVYIDTWQVDVVRVELADFDDLFDFGDRESGRFCH